MQQFEAIIFDLGGTLIEYASKFKTWPELETPGLEAAHQYLSGKGVIAPELNQFKNTGFSLLPSLWKGATDGKENLTVPIFLSNIFYQLDFDVPRSKHLESAAYHYEKAICAGAEPLPHSQEILQELNEAGFRLGLISNTMFSSQSHLEDLRGFGLLPYFQSTLFSAEVNQWKPSEEPFLSVIKRLETTPSTTVFVGDDPGADIIGAKAAGLKVIHFASSDRFPAVDGHQPDATIYHLQEVTAVLEVLNR